MRLSPIVTKETVHYGEKMSDMNNSTLPDRWWHVRLRKKGQKATVYLNDLTLADLASRILNPWSASQPFTVSGVIFKSSSDVDEVQIVATTRSQQQYAADHDALMNERNIFDMATDRRWLPFEDGKDYTNELLFASETTASGTVTGPVQQSKKVFIVHGRDEEMKSAAARLIAQCGLEPIILHEQPNKGRTIIEKFADYADVGFAVVLLSPDDEMNDGSRRARQNVILERGYFLGKLGRMRVAALFRNAENFEIPSDFAGVLYTEYDGGGWRYAIAKELRAAGFAVDLNAI